jgi:hypothetical protein
MRRIDGSNGAYLAIGEFRPPFSGYFPTFALSSYQVMIFTLAGLAVLAGWLSASGRRDAPGRSEDVEERFDVAPLAFAAALAWLSILARRNIGIFAIGIVPFLGSTLGIALAHRPKLSSNAARVASLLVLASGFVIGAQAATNGWYARTGETHEFGLGVFKSNFQPRATQFFREQKLPGPTYNDMTTGGYLTWDDPSGKGVYIDGRLEVYDTPFFQAYLNHLTDIESWKREVDARGIQTVTIFHRWEVGHALIRAVDATGEWLLVYYDETVVIFVKAAPGNADVIDAARAAFAKTWLPRNDAALTGPRQTARWQWGLDRITGQMAYARALETIGDTKEALIWFQVAITGGLPPSDEVEARQHAADCLVALGEPAQARVHLVRALELDPASDVTLDMLRRLNELGPQ